MRRHQRFAVMQQKMIAAEQSEPQRTVEKAPEPVPSPPVFVCGDCGYESKSPAGLAAHRRAKHGNKGGPA